MQPTGGLPGNANFTPEQLAQMQQMYYAQFGGQLGLQPGQTGMMAPAQAYATASMQQQYAMNPAAMAALPRAAAGTPPPGMASASMQQQQPQQQAQQSHQQPQQQPRQSADGGDVDFDFDAIPSPEGSPVGAGTGMPAVQQSQPLLQHPQQQSLPFPAGVNPASLHMAQPAQPNVQQQQLQHQLQQQQQQQQQLIAQRMEEQRQAAEQARIAEEVVQKQMQARARQQQQQQQRQSPMPPGTGAAAGGARSAPSPTAGMTSAQAAIANADAVAAKSARRGPVIPTPVTQRPPGMVQPATAAAGVPAATQLQQAQNAMQAAEAKKRKRDAALLPPPEDALSLEQVIQRLQGGVGRQMPGLPGMSVAPGIGPGTDGPSVSVDEILKKPEYQKAAAAAGSTAAKAGKGRPGGRGEDENRVLPELKLKRLLELQGLNKSFRLQPELQDQLIKLAEAFVNEAVEFGCSLAARRRGSTLRPADLALYMQRTHHITIPGFSKEYTPYKRPVVNDAHRQRMIAVRKAQLHPQQHATAAGEGGGAGAAGKAAGTVRFSGAE